MSLAGHIGDVLVRHDGNVQARLVDDPGRSHSAEALPKLGALMESAAKAAQASEKGKRKLRAMAEGK